MKFSSSGKNPPQARTAATNDVTNFSPTIGSPSMICRMMLRTSISFPWSSGSATPRRLQRRRISLRVGPMLRPRTFATHLGSSVTRSSDSVPSPRTRSLGRPSPLQGLVRPPRGRAWGSRPAFHPVPCRSFSIRPRLDKSRSPGRHSGRPVCFASSLSTQLPANSPHVCSVCRACSQAVRTTRKPIGVLMSEAQNRLSSVATSVHI